MSQSTDHPPPQEQQDASDGAAVYRPLANALRHVLVAAERSNLALGGIYTWQLMANDNQHGSQPVVSGQSSKTRGAEEIRSVIAAWATEFDGEVVEQTGPGWAPLEARFYIGGVLCVVWNIVPPEVPE